MVTWQAIPEDHSNGIIKAYAVKVLDSDETIYVCNGSLTWEIQELEKSMDYKIKVAGVTSKGRGNFSEDVLVLTNLDGRSDKPLIFLFYYMLDVFDLVSLHSTYTDVHHNVALPIYITDWYITDDWSL